MPEEAIHFIVSLKMLEFPGNTISLFYSILNQPVYAADLRAEINLQFEIIII